MEISDGTREAKIHAQALELLNQWREDLAIRIEAEGNPVTGVALPVYLTATYTLYTQLKAFIEKSGGVTWMEPPPGGTE